MTQPLALVLYEKLLPGSQLVNLLQDMNYRVQVLADEKNLVDCAQQAMPLVVLADVGTRTAAVCAAISQLKQAPTTKHLPVIAFSSQCDAQLQKEAQSAGATLTVSDNALLNHLPQLLDQALQLD